MNVALVAFAVVAAINALAVVYQIGKPREPITHGLAIMVILLNVAEIIVLVSAALR